MVDSIPLARPFMKKRLSILMAIKNGERFLRETLDSLFAEVGEEDEVIAVDDGSIDESPRILGRYPLRLFACPAPGGTRPGEKPSRRKSARRVCDLSRSGRPRGFGKLLKKA